MFKFCCGLVLLAFIGGLDGVRADDSIKVLSYNIRYASLADGADRWPHRRAAVAALIAQQDIAGLQEVTFPQLQDLSEQLSEFESYSVGRQDGKAAGEHCTIFFRKNRFDPLDQGTFWLSETPEVPGSKSWDAAIMRICSWVVMRDKQTDKEFLFANTHFDHMGRTARVESGKLIKQMLTDKFPELPTILVGDFNCLPDSEPYQAIIAEGGKELADARGVSDTPASGPDSTWSGFRQIIPGRIIDHIFVSESVTVKSLTVLNPKTDKDRFASDHLPVQAVITLTGK